MQASWSLPATPIERAVAEHRAYLMRFARQRVRDRALVEDVVHDTIVAALQGAAQFAGRASARTWLTGILLRRIADVLRRQRRAAQIPNHRSAAADDARAADGEATAHEPLVDHHDPQRLLEGRQTVQGLEACLRRLPPESARIVVMREIEGLSTDETAQRLGLAPAAVSSALHRARQRLRRCLSCG